MNYSKWRRREAEATWAEIERKLDEQGKKRFKS
jgi:hypothetical protein